MIDPKTELSLLEAKLFASSELAVIEAIDACADAAEAVERLRALGMSATEAEAVLELPFRARTLADRRELLEAAERLRAAGY